MDRDKRFVRIMKFYATMTSINEARLQRNLAIRKSFGRLPDAEINPRVRVLIGKVLEEYAQKVFDLESENLRIQRLMAIALHKLDEESLNNLFQASDFK